MPRTGVSLTYQIGSVLGAGMAALMAAWLVGLGNGGGTDNIAWYFIVLVAIAAAAVYFSRETRPRRQPQTIREPAPANH